MELIFSIYSLRNSIPHMPVLVPARDWLGDSTKVAFCGDGHLRALCQAQRVGSDAVRSLFFHHCLNLALQLRFGHALRHFLGYRYSGNGHGVSGKSRHAGALESVMHFPGRRLYGDYSCTF